MAVLVTAAFLGDSTWLQAFAAVASVVLGAAATRITYSELLQTRRDAARDRAEQARDYRALTEERTAEHAEFSARMTARVDRQDFPIAMERGTGEGLKFLYLDARKVFGHYLEYTWMPDAMWEQIRGM